MIEIVRKYACLLAHHRQDKAELADIYQACPHHQHGLVTVSEKPCNRRADNEFYQYYRYRHEGDSAQMIQYIWSVGNHTQGDEEQGGKRIAQGEDIRKSLPRVAGLAYQEAGGESPERSEEQTSELQSR